MDAAVAALDPIKSHTLDALIMSHCERTSSEVGFLSYFEALIVFFTAHGMVTANRIDKTALNSVPSLLSATKNNIFVLSFSLRVLERNMDELFAASRRWLSKSIALPTGPTTKRMVIAGGLYLRFRVPFFVTDCSGRRSQGALPRLRLGIAEINYLRLVKQEDVES
jgi:hypothetical protein